MITYWILPSVERAKLKYIYIYLCIFVSSIFRSFKQFQHARFDIYDLQWETDGYYAMQQWRKLPLDAVADKVLRPIS